LKEAKYFKIEHIVIVVLSLIIAAVITHSAMFVRQNYMLRQELDEVQESFHDMLLVQASLDAEIQEGKIQKDELQAELEAMKLVDLTHYRVLQHISDVAPEILWYFFDEDVELNDPDEFVMLPNNRILISGQWFCEYHEMMHAIEAIFWYRIRNDEIWLDLLVYSPFEWASWRDPWESYFHRYSWVRTHELETVPVRFHWIDGDGVTTGYNTEYISGENFTEELAYHALQHLNRIIIDAWFVGRILYVNLHHSEPMRMSSGTFGEYVMSSTLISSMSSVPGIDALVILVDGQRGATFGGHGAAFMDIYLISD